MTPRNAPWQSYKQISTTTAPPEQLVLMLYDGAISYLERSLGGFEFKDPLQFNQTINNNVQRAQAIIHEMNSRLDMDQGGEISQNLRRLYSYFYRRLQEANMKKTRNPIDEVLKHLREIRESWAEMLHRGHRGEDGEAEATVESGMRTA
jgi:flagellar protein FliS